MGVTNFDVVQASAFIGGRFSGQGKQLFVAPYSGSNGHSGRSPKSPLKTLAQALTLATADKNDVVQLLAESNTAAYTTDYQAATLDWNKDLTHLLGVNSGSMFSQRSRIAFLSTYNTASNLFTVSADGCRFEDLELFAGVAGTAPTGCLKVTGDRNVFVNCHIAGIGHDNNDITDAYSLYLSGSENVFRHCAIGLDTISRGTEDCSEIVLAGGGARNIFEDCLILTFGSVNTHQFVKRPISGTDRSTIFKRCQFLNYSWPAGGGVDLLEVFDVTPSGSPAGYIDLFDCSFAGAVAWEAITEASGIVRANSLIAGSASATTGQRATVVTGA